jgi:hypothetical protein
MNRFFKVILTLFVAFAVLSILWGVYVAVGGSYIQHSPFNSLFAFLLLAVLLYGAYHAVRRIWGLTIILALFLFQSCQYAKSNQQVVVSNDCGMSWTKINAGESVPTKGVNACYMKVVIPNYPMQGESKFISNLRERVRASVHIDYDYTITEPLAFIRQAKYLGRANTDADDSEAISDERFEGAENMVIDKRIKDVAKRVFITEDIVELDQSDLEARLLTESNEVLSKYGVQLNFITLTFDLDEQTRQAIDVSTAMKIYASKGLNDLGKVVIAARAGATKVSVENKIPEQTIKE